jgi:hypothetical protein
MEFKFDDTIINTLNTKFNGFLEMLKSLVTIYNTWCVDNWACCAQYEESHHMQFLVEFYVCHNVTMKILIQSLVNPWWE